VLRSEGSTLYAQPIATASKRVLATRSIDAAIPITKLLGSPSGAGMALVEAYFGTGSSWVTCQHAANRANVSEDTARRRLTELVGAGRAHISLDHGRDTRTKHYRIVQPVADSVMAKLITAQAE